MNPTPSPDAPRSRLASAWRILKGSFVFLVVVFHLFILLVRNPLDLWDEAIYVYVYSVYLNPDDWPRDELENALVKEHGKPLRKRTAEEVETKLRNRGYTEKQITEAVAAFNKLAWFRYTDRLSRKYLNLVGCEQGWSMFTPRMARGGKFLGYRYEFKDGSTELVLADRTPRKPNRFFMFGGWQERKLEEYLLDQDARDEDERMLWEAYARYVIRRWKKENPDDSRKLIGVSLMKVRYKFPALDDDPSEFDEPTVKVAWSFDAEGRLLP